MGEKEFINISDVISETNARVIPDTNTRNENIDLEQINIDRYNNTKKSSDVYQCELCGNKGMIAYKNNYNRMSFKRCKCYDIRQNREKMKELGLLDFISTTYAIENLQPKEDWEKRVVRVANEYIENRTNLSFFYGGAVGGGKTTICANMMAHKIQQNPELMADYIVWDTSYRDLEFSENGSERLEELKKVDILFIDDMFRSARVKAINEVEREKAKAIIDYRYRNKLITIISSELYLNEIEAIDEAIGSRIYEMCGKGKFALSVKREKNRNHRKVKEKIEENKMTSLLDE